MIATRSNQWPEARQHRALGKYLNARLVDGDHNIDCRIEGFGRMALKSEFVKKV